jgi:hypothetical protein
MIQKQSNNHHSGRTHKHQEQKESTACPEFNREHAHRFFSDMKMIVHYEFVPPNITVNSNFYFEMFERKCAKKKTRTLAQPQLAPSSRQCTCPHVPDNHRVCD